jgi:hypothetical protein
VDRTAEPAYIYNPEFPSIAKLNGGSNRLRTGQERKTSFNRDGVTAGARRRVAGSLMTVVIAQKRRVSEDVSGKQGASVPCQERG